MSVRLNRDGEVRGRRRRCIDHGGLDTKLGLGFGSTVELFVDGGVGFVQENVVTGAVGIAFEDDVNICWNAEKQAELDPRHQLVNTHP